MRCIAPALFLLTCGGQPGAGASSCPQAPAPVPAAVATPARPDAAPSEVVRAYLDATAARDLDSAAKLVNERSVVFESGGNEGTWSNYRAHHLGAEVAQFEAFEIRPGDMTTSMSTDGTLALVTVPLEYDITLKDGRRIESSGTVTFALSPLDGQYRIDHVHWSSRRRQAPQH